MLELDTAPRDVEVPKDLAAALKKADARTAFDALAFTPPQGTCPRDRGSQGSGDAGAPDRQGGAMVLEEVLRPLSPCVQIFVAFQVTPSNVSGQPA